MEPHRFFIRTEHIVLAHRLSDLRLASVSAQFAGQHQYRRVRVVGGADGGDTAIRRFLTDQPVHHVTVEQALLQRLAEAVDIVKRHCVETAAAEVLGQLIGRLMRIVQYRNVNRSSSP